jgi:PAS domain S-box
MSEAEAPSVQRDIEQALRVAGEDYRALVEQVPAILYTDAPGQEEDGVYVNPHIEHVLGITRQDFLETDAWIEMLHPEDRERASLFLNCSTSSAD